MNDLDSGNVITVASDEAFNNVVKGKSNFPTGVWDSDWYNPHPEKKNIECKNNDIGTQGIYIFDVPGGGFGVHSGRCNAQAKTKGCIRTTEDFMKHINDIVKGDPIDFIIVR